MDDFQYPRMYLCRRIVQAKLFIDCHYAEPIHVGNIASEAHFSRFHFIRLFRKTYGKTPHQYLTSVRIGHAKELLKSSKTVGEVCGEVGFESITSFTALFKKTVHSTPSTWQATHRARKFEIQKQPLLYIPGCIAAEQGWTKK